ncbi:MAG: hypothetical protein HY690_06115 [Chloroflexi bacterium]|nr:hypothetical protein [Chloroflexota bacterium]
MINNAADWKRLLSEVIAGERGTVTLHALLIISATTVRPDSPLLRHEQGHVEQANELGAAYLPTYIRQRGEVSGALQAIGIPGTDRNVYKLHPMEVDANRRASLSLLWHGNATP